MTRVNTTCVNFQLWLGAQGRTIDEKIIAAAQSRELLSGGWGWGWGVGAYHKV